MPFVVIPQPFPASPLRRRYSTPRTNRLRKELDTLRERKKAMEDDARTVGECAG